MASSKENLKGLMTNARTRVIILFTVGILLFGFVVAYFKFFNNTRGVELSTQLDNAPGGISSTPGALNQTAEYARLQTKQNTLNAQQALSKGSSSIPTLIDLKSFGDGVDTVGPQNGTGGLGFAALSSLGNGTEKPLWMQNLGNTNCSADTIKVAMAQSASITTLRESCSCEQLKNSGFNLNNLNTVCDCSQLRSLGYTVTNFKDIGYSPEQLKICNFSACEMKGAGFDAAQMKSGGYSDDELKGAGFTPEAIEAASGLPTGVSADDVRKADCSPENLAALKAKGVSAAAIRRISGCDAAQLKAAGFSATDLKTAGYSPAQLKAAGFDASQLKQAGFTPRELKNAGYGTDSLLNAGFSPAEIRALSQSLPDGISPADVRNKGCSASELKKEHDAGVSALAISKIAGCSADALKAGGYSPEELKIAGLSSGSAGLSQSLPDGISPADAEIKEAGCDPAKLSVLQKNGVSAADIMKINHCDLATLKASGFTAADLLAAGATPAQLASAGFSPQEVAAAAAIKAAGCDSAKLSILQKKGASAADIMKINHCDVATLKASGFTAADLLAAGATPAQLASAGFTPQEVAAATDSAIKAAGCDPEKLSVLQKKGVSAADIMKINHCDLSTLKASGFTAADLLAAGATPAQLASAGFSPQEVAAAAAIKAAGCDPAKLSVLQKNGVSAADIMKINHCDLSTLKASGFTAADLLAAGATPAQLASAGFSPAEVSATTDAGIKAAGCDPAKLSTLQKNGVSAARIMQINHCDLSTLKASGFSAGDLLAAGATPSQLASVAFSPEEVAAAETNPIDAIAGSKTGNCSIEAATAAKKAGMTSEMMRKNMGCSAKILSQIGFSPKDLKNAGFTVGELTKAGLSVPQLLSAGFSPTDLKAAGFSAKDLKDAGLSAADLLRAGFKPEQLVNAGYSAKDLLDGGLSPEGLKKLGYNAGTLKGLGLTASQLKAAGFGADELKLAGFPNDSLQNTDTDAKDQALAKLINVNPPSSSIAEIPGVKPTSNNNQQAIANLNTAVEEQKKMQAALKYQQKIQQKMIEIQTYASQLVQGWKDFSPQIYLEATKANDKNKQTPGDIAMPLNKRMNRGDDDDMDNKKQDLYVKTGDILFAVIETSVNTDEPSPILATIVSGSLKGAKLIGSFNLPANASKMIITFSSMTLPGIAKTIGISAYAIDPNTGRTALSSSTDHHYLQRYGSLFASTFLEGFGNAFQSANTTIQVGGTGGVTNTTVQNGIGRSLTSNAVIGLATVGKAWGQQAQRNMNTPTTVQVYSGTPVGVLFLQDIVIDSNVSK